MSTNTLDGNTFVRLVNGGAENLQANADIVNELNVFPIPDGDTGVNMCMTISGGIGRLGKLESPTIADASRALADGMLMNARGNSGVILSRLFEGIANGLENKETADLEDVSNALQKGVKSAYEAVYEPTEGTILTVAREAADFAAGRINKHSTLESFAEDYLDELKRSLMRTPEKLKVLKDAGVIDSGGAGLYYIAQGAKNAADGKNSENYEPSFKDKDSDISSPQIQPVSDVKFDENSVMEYGYCTEFLLQLLKSKTDPESFDVNIIKDYLSTVGDSVVIFKTGSIIKVHVHTMTPGEVLEFCRKYGEFTSVKIENMTLQHSETVIRNRFDMENEDNNTVLNSDGLIKSGDLNSGSIDTDGDNNADCKNFAVICVASGEGVKNVFSSLGAGEVIDGGQGKNPSTGDFIKAFDRVNAKTVFVLPNNSNIFLAAKQAAEMYKKSDVRIIESRNVGDCYAALSMLSFDSGDPDEIQSLLQDAMKGVITAMVCPSVRSAKIDGVDIKKDDFIGFTDKRVLVDRNDRVDAALATLDALNAGDHEILITLYGENIGEAEKQNFRERVKNTYKTTELYETDGGQKTYDYLLILQ